MNTISDKLNPEQTKAIEAIKLDQFLERYKKARTHFFKDLSRCNAAWGNDQREIFKLNEKDLEMSHDLAIKFMEKYT